MAPSIGLNLRVTGYKHQGGRKYMEDEFGVAYQQTADEKDLEYAFFGIFDGHGGREAALFAKEHLMDFIVRQKGFWAEDDESVLKAIHEGFIQTHYAMWKELEKWPKTASGLPSTAGTTASIAFIRRGKIYIGHVGDSAIVLGYQDQDNPDIWRAEPLTRDHKPESLEESERITQCGGKVICKAGVPRVVWNRPRMGHKGPVRRSTHIDEIPFLAVARSLGDLWSYNSEENVFVVSPEPDIRVYPVDITRHRCLVLATDGCWNMLTPQNSISTVCAAEKTNEQHMLAPVEGRTCWINPSKQLVDCAVDRWTGSKLRADNTSVVTVMLDPPGPPRAQVLKTRKRELAALNAGQELPTAPGLSGSVALVTNTTVEPRVEQREEHRHLMPPPPLTPPTPPLAPPPALALPGSRRDGQRQPQSTDTVQCNEISSSEDTSRDSGGQTASSPAQPPRSPTPPYIPASPTPPSQAKTVPRSLARELNGLDSPGESPRVSTRSQSSTRRTPSTPRTPITPRTPSHRVKRLTLPQKPARRRLAVKPISVEEPRPSQSSDGLERLTADLDSCGVSVTTPRQLRSRTPGQSGSATPASAVSKIVTPGSGKRKRTATPKRDIPPRKSPRVVAQLPKVTHSKHAKVLKLKKH